MGKLVIGWSSLIIHLLRYSSEVKRKVKMTRKARKKRARKTNTKNKRMERKILRKKRKVRAKVGIHTKKNKNRHNSKTNNSLMCRVLNPSKPSQPRKK